MAFHKEGKIRQRAKASSTGKNPTDDDKTKRKKKPLKFSRRKASTRYHSLLSSIPEEHRLNAVLALVLFFLLLITYGPDTVSSMKSGNLRFTSEPLPTIDKLTTALTSWDKNTTKISTLLQPLPGPIPNHLFIGPCENNFQMEMGKCQPNIDNTISRYATALSNFSSPVRHLTDDVCIPIIQNVEPSLLDAFKHETAVINKSYICRVAALYLYGGYYIDNDVEVVTPVIIPDKASFSTVVEEPGTGFFQAFLASTPHHPVLEYTLKNMVAHYDKALIRPDNSKGDGDVSNPTYDAFKSMKDEIEAGRDDIPTYDDFEVGVSRPYIDFAYMSELEAKEPGWNLGTRTLKDAFAALPAKSRGETFILQEIHLSDDHGKWYPELKRRVSEKCCCNFVVHDPRTRIVHFWSRIVGSAFC